MKSSKNKKMGYPLLILEPPWHSYIFTAVGGQLAFYPSRLQYRGPCWLYVASTAAAVQRPFSEAEIASLLAGGQPIAPRRPLCEKGIEAFCHHVAVVAGLLSPGDPSAGLEQLMQEGQIAVNTRLTVHKEPGEKRMLPYKAGKALPLGHVVGMAMIVGRSGERDDLELPSWGGSSVRKLTSAELARRPPLTMAGVCIALSHAEPLARPTKVRMSTWQGAPVPMDVQRKLESLMLCRAHEDCRQSPELARACTLERHGS